MFHDRKSKTEACARIKTCFQSPVPEHVEDCAWTPGNWRECAEDDSEDEDPFNTPRKLAVYNKAMANIASLSDVKTIEPLTFVLNCNWNETTKAEKAACIEKVDEACQAVCKVIAPTSSEDLLRAYRAITRDSSEDDNLKALVTAYKNAPTKNSKTQILSIYATRYTTIQLKNIHKPFEILSDRQIKKARAHAKKVGIGISIEKQPTHRIRMDLTKLDHFLTFVDQPYFYQDVAFGTRTLKLESGEKLVMPNVVRTVTRATMIEQYFKFCTEENVQPLGRSTLFRILQVREASQRKSLQGLDNIAAAGGDGFETMHDSVNTLQNLGADPKWCEETRNSLKAGKRYLKTDYRVHCREDESSCPDHCKRYALSDPQDKDFQEHCTHEHCDVCDKCEKLKDVIQAVADKIESPSISFYSTEQKEDLKYDLNQAEEMIYQWKSHIMRAENQDRSKQNVLNNLQSNSLFIIMDWAMKFTQLKYREKQSEWYGKRGMNWHVTCVISKSPTDENLEITSYAHLFDSCGQDWYAVCAILEDLLKTLKVQNPELNQVYLRSDGAGCYDNHSLISAIFDIGNRIGLKVRRY